MRKSRSNLRKQSVSRRRFLKTVGGAASLSAAGIGISVADAKGLERVSEDDPTAVALKYVHDASTVDESIRPQKDRICSNCALYAGSEEDEWAGCSIFPGKAVAGRGWCSVWAPK